MNRRGYTLIELLVVIAIVGVLAALLLPAIQAARESAQRTQCKNHLKQIGLAIHQFEGTRQEFPQGGTVPWPDLEYVSQRGGVGLRVVALGWAYHILPYLEAENIHELPTHEQMQGIVVDMYFCPARRNATVFASPEVTQGQRQFHALMDFAAATPGPFRRVGGGIVSATDRDAIVGDFWRGSVNNVVFDEAYFGVVTRTLACEPVTHGRIIDGTAYTLLVSEKRHTVARYLTGDWFDDRGWTAGWSVDTIRSTGFPPEPDDTTRTGDGLFNPEVSEISPDDWQLGHQFGSSHPSGINAVFADGRVATISYAIDRDTFNCLGDRRDGLYVTPP